MLNPAERLAEVVDVREAPFARDLFQRRARRQQHARRFLHPHLRHATRAGEARARAVVHETTQWQETGEVLAASRGLGAAMAGLEISTIPENERLANRGW